MIISDCLLRLITPLAFDDGIMVPFLASNPFLSISTNPSETAQQTTPYIIDRVTHEDWANDPERDHIDFQIYRRLSHNMQEYLEETHALSPYAHDTFWHDLTKAFPRVVGWVLG